MAWLISIVGALISAIIASLFVLWLEKLRKPKLVFEMLKTRTIDYGIDTKKPAQILRVCELNLRNIDLPKYLKWFMSRNTAVHCYGYITFYDKDGNKVTNNKMPVKWAKFPRIEVLQGGQYTEHPLYDVLYMDIQSGEKETLDVANRCNNEPECYGWNNDSYFHNWRDPNWKLNGPNDYYVKVIIISAGIRCEDIFKLHIGKNPVDFTLTPVEKTDKEKILGYPELINE